MDDCAAARINLDRTCTAHLSIWSTWTSCTLFSFEAWEAAQLALLRMRLILQRASLKKPVLKGKLNDECTFDTSQGRLSRRHTRLALAGRPTGRGTSRRRSTGFSESSERALHRTTRSPSEFSKKRNRHRLQCLEPPDLHHHPVQLSHSRGQVALLRPKTSNQTSAQGLSTLILNLKTATATLIKVTTERDHQIRIANRNGRHQRCENGAELIMSTEKFMVNSSPEQLA